MKVRKKPIILDAEYATEAGDVETLEGVLHYAKGDVLMTGAFGEHYPIKRAIFEDTYDVLTPGVEIPGEAP